jgi:ABC-type transporter Mla subunit MlaD
MSRIEDELSSEDIDALLSNLNYAWDVVDKVRAERDSALAEVERLHGTIAAMDSQLEAER